mgnify:CR=1 FL=1
MLGDAVLWNLVRAKEHLTGALKIERGGDFADGDILTGLGSVLSILDRLIHQKTESGMLPVETGGSDDGS